MKRGYDNMKAKVEINNKSDIILSIGMIVKNEEKVLGRCLESLKPLMAAIPSELIIADTGSTDRTVEIAKKYTENVIQKILRIHVPKLTATAQTTFSKALPS